MDLPQPVGTMHPADTAPDDVEAPTGSANGPVEVTAAHSDRPADAELAMLSWPRDRLGQALEALARRSGLLVAKGRAPPAIPPGDASADTGEWIEFVAAGMGVEAEAVEFKLPSFDRFLAKACPMVRALDDPGERRFLLLLKARRRHVVLVGPDLRLHRCSLERIRRAATGPIEAPLVRDVNQLLEAAKVDGRRRGKVRSAMLRERLATRMVGDGWILRPAATASFLSQLRYAGLIRRLGWITALLMGVYLAEIVGWGLIGSATLDSRLDLAWLVAWLLLVVSDLPLRLGASWLDATFALDLGRVLKKRLLDGALCMDIDAVRRQGVGQLLGRVMESQALEMLALNGGMTVIVAALELMFSAWILTEGAGGYRHLAALLIWLVAVSAACWRYHRRLRHWSLLRLSITHELVEQMVGHRTRLAQEPPRLRDEADDRTMHAYLAASQDLDRALVPVVAGASSGWVILALLVLTPTFIAGTASAAALAISIGGILLAGRACAGLSQGVTSLSQACIAWTMVADLFRAADRPLDRTAAPPPEQAATDRPQRKLIDASDLAFRYRPDGRAILQGLDLTIHHGDRVLLEGPSGGGKSTLAALLTGLRKPDSGLLLLDGLDRPTLGSRWHRLSTEAPQFHENHILAGPLAFNLLMGRNWPPSDEDLETARRLCVELGLGPLLSRMPAGLLQHVGETGWQLSHGERSRVYLARALLQDARLTILDESFAALDPETLKTCLSAAIANARTLVVIAHP